MIRSKTVAMACASGLLSSTASHGAVDFTVGTTKSFRQLQGDSIQFRGGSLSVGMLDGSVAYGGCASDFFSPVGGSCASGTSGLLDFGNLENITDITTEPGPYYDVTGIVPAVVIEPSQPNRAFLRAAPPSTLTRPLYNFSDSSAGLYYNLLSNDVSLYKISGYQSKRNYRFGKSQRAAFDSDLPPGVYHYSFPRLNQPTLFANIASTLYPFTDAFNVKNNQKTGLLFDTKGFSWDSRGFIKLNYFSPNTIRWSGLRTSEIIVGRDKLYFSILYTTSSTNPKSAVTTEDPLTGVSPVAIFPPYTNGSSTETSPPNVLLKNALVSEFTIPPVLESGDVGVVRLELVRALQTGGVTYDSSRRIFELPIKVINRYSEYRNYRFGGSGPLTGIVEDYDGDGYNNLTEWILDSAADDPHDIPDEPVPAARPAQTVGGIDFPSYFGFSVIKKRGSVPAVNYSLQRSIDAGATWTPVFSDLNWTVYQDAYQIRLISNSGSRPAGTTNHRFRVKITRR